MRWLNSTLKERVNTPNKREAMKLIDRATADVQRRHLANLYLSGAVSKNRLRRVPQSPERTTREVMGQRNPSHEKKC